MWASESSEPVGLTPTSEGLRGSASALGLTFALDRAFCVEISVFCTWLGGRLSVDSLHSKACLKFDLG